LGDGEGGGRGKKTNQGDVHPEIDYEEKRGPRGKTRKSMGNAPLGLIRNEGGGGDVNPFSPCPFWGGDKF